MCKACLQHRDYSSRFRILKGGKISLIVSAFIATATLLHAAPTGGIVTSGNATITQNGTTTTINQSTQKASINWSAFSIASSEIVNFNQPSVSSITLNRVVGNETSVIDGALNANGQVWILNSNGVLFGKNASINTSGLLATTKSLSDEDFQNGNYRFTGDSTASVINIGTIEIANGGYASLLANTVQNEGTITAIKGTVTLTGASEATINLNGNSLVSLTVDKGVLDALVENKGAIYADGGAIYLTTNAVDELLKSVVNNTGILEANAIDDLTGTIILYAHGGITNVSGTLSATDGFLETSGNTLHVNDDVSIQAKEWLLDPADITITNGGTDSISGSTIDADTITTVLNNGTNVTLTATNDITVNEAIAWSSATQLKLTAGDEIYVNATIANTNTTYGGVYFNAANTTSKVIFGTTGKVMVYNPYQLQWINMALAGKYELGGNIDATTTSTWTSGAGFVPIGDATNKFTGTLDGNGYVINGLAINLSTVSYVGLIGYAGTGSVIQDIGLTNASIVGSSYVGSLVGYLYYGTVSNAYATGSVAGTTYVGGLVGYNRSGTIINTYASASVSGDNKVGGLVGQNYSGTISYSYATGNVNATTNAGGLIGYNNSSGIITANFWNTETSGQSSGIGGGTSSSGLSGKTTEEMQTLSTFTDAGWSIERDSSLAVGTPVLTMSDGTSTWKIGIELPASTPTIPNLSTQTQNITPIITQITNGTATTLVIPTITLPVLSNTTMTQFSNNGQTYDLSLQPVEGAQTQAISLQELIALMGIEGSLSASMPFLPKLSLTFTQGGMNLPDGLEQEFYIAQK